MSEQKPRPNIPNSWNYNIEKQLQDLRASSAKGTDIPIEDYFI